VRTAARPLGALARRRRLALRLLYGDWGRPHREPVFARVVRAEAARRVTFDERTSGVPDDRALVEDPVEVAAEPEPLLAG
jgi:hypothetical protein